MTSSAAATNVDAAPPAITSYDGVVIPTDRPTRLRRAAAPTTLKDIDEDELKTRKVDNYADLTDEEADDGNGKAAAKARRGGRRRKSAGDDQHDAMMAAVELAIAGTPLATQPQQQQRTLSDRDPHHHPMAAKRKYQRQNSASPAAPTKSSKHTSRAAAVTTKQHGGRRAKSVDHAVVQQGKRRKGVQPAADDMDVDGEEVTPSLNHYGGFTASHYLPSPTAAATAEELQRYQQHQKKINNSYRRWAAERRRQMLETRRDLFEPFLMSKKKALAPTPLPPPAPAVTNPSPPGKRRGPPKSQQQDVAPTTAIAPANTYSRHHVPSYITDSPSYINANLRHYQLDGVNWIISHFDSGVGCVLADEMGLGKTLQSLTFLAYLKQERKLNGPSVVLVPLAVAQNWVNELKRFCPTLTYVKFSGAVAERDLLLDELRFQSGAYDIVVTTFETFIAEMEFFQNDQIRWLSIIIDEAHRIKTVTARVREALTGMKSGFQLLLTGTPLQNNLLELWSLLDYLLPDVKLNPQIFLDCFDIDKHSLMTDLIPKAAALLDSVMLRRTKAQVEKTLPPKTLINIYVPLTKLQIKLYRRLLQKDIALQDKLSYSQLMFVLVQLRKVCNHPSTLFIHRTSATNDNKYKALFAHLQTAEDIPSLITHRRDIQQQFGQRRGSFEPLMPQPVEPVRPRKGRRSAADRAVALQQFHQQMAAAQQQQLYAQHPNASVPRLQAASHDTVMSTDGSVAASPIGGQPHTLQQLPSGQYTYSLTNMPTAYSHASIATANGSPNRAGDGFSIDIDVNLPFHHEEYKDENGKITIMHSCRHTCGCRHRATTGPIVLMDKPAAFPHRGSRYTHELRASLHPYCKEPHACYVLTRKGVQQAKEKEELYRFEQAALNGSLTGVVNADDDSDSEDSDDVSVVKSEQNGLKQETASAVSSVKPETVPVSDVKHEASAHPALSTVAITKTADNEVVMQDVSDQQVAPPSSQRAPPAPVQPVTVPAPPTADAEEGDMIEAYRAVALDTDAVITIVMLEPNGNLYIDFEPNQLHYIELDLANINEQDLDYRYMPIDQLIRAGGKLTLMHKLLHRLRAEGSRCLIFTHFTSCLDVLERYVLEQNWRYKRMDGHTNRIIRELDIRDFNRHPDAYFLYLISTKSGGQGINLASADVVILYDCDWNPQSDLQAEDRAHRIGQVKPVRVYRLVTENSVEERIVQRAMKKLALDAMVVGKGGAGQKNLLRNAAKAPTASDINSNETQPSISSREVFNMLKYGADTIFRSTGTDITDVDLDALLSRSKRHEEAKSSQIEELDDANADVNTDLVQSGIDSIFNLEFRERLPDEPATVNETAQHDHGKLTGAVDDDSSNEGSASSDSSDSDSETESIARVPFAGAKYQCRHCGAVNIITTAQTHCVVCDVSLTQRPRKQPAPSPKDSGDDNLSEKKEADDAEDETDDAPVSRRSKRVRKTRQVLLPEVEQSKQHRPKMLHERDCFICEEAGDQMVFCSQCPKTYHSTCIDMGNTPRGRWTCGWHRCVACLKGKSLVGGVLFACISCPTSYCFDDLPEDTKVLRLTEDHPVIRSLRAHNYKVNFDHLMFYQCQSCKTQYSQLKEVAEKKQLELEAAENQRIQRSKALSATNLLLTDQQGQNRHDKEEAARNEWRRRREIQSMEQAELQDLQERYMHCLNDQQRMFILVCANEAPESIYAQEEYARLRVSGKLPADAQQRVMTSFQLNGYTPDQADPMAQQLAVHANNGITYSNPNEPRKAPGPPKRYSQHSIELPNPMRSDDLKTLRLAYLDNTVQPPTVQFYNLPNNIFRCKSCVAHKTDPNAIYVGHVCPSVRQIQSHPATSPLLPMLTQKQIRQIRGIRERDEKRFQSHYVKCVAHYGQVKKLGGAAAAGGGEEQKSADDVMLDDTEDDDDVTDQPAASPTNAADDAPNNGTSTPTPGDTNGAAPGSQQAGVEYEEIINLNNAAPLKLRGTPPQQAAARRRPANNSAAQLSNRQQMQLKAQGFAPQLQAHPFEHPALIQFAQYNIYPNSMEVQQLTQITGLPIEHVASFFSVQQHHYQAMQQAHAQQQQQIRAMQHTQSAPHSLGGAGSAAVPQQCLWKAIPATYLTTGERIHFFNKLYEYLGQPVALQCPTVHKQTIDLFVFWWAAIMENLPNAWSAEQWQLYFQLIDFDTSASDAAAVQQLSVQLTDVFYKYNLHTFPPPYQQQMEAQQLAEALRLTLHTLQTSPSPPSNGSDQWRWMEDVALLAAVQLFGLNWYYIQNHPYVGPRLRRLDLKALVARYDELVKWHQSQHQHQQPPAAMQAIPVDVPAQPVATQQVEAESKATPVDTV